jgi:hypothetical protein
MTWVNSGSTVMENGEPSAGTQDAARLIIATGPMSLTSVTIILASLST